MCIIVFLASVCKIDQLFIHIGGRGFKILKIVYYAMEIAIIHEKSSSGNLF
jgi:hypothetical protein